MKILLIPKIIFQRGEWLQIPGGHSSRYPKGLTCSRLTRYARFGITGQHASDVGVSCPQKNENH